MLFNFQGSKRTPERGKEEARGGVAQLGEHLPCKQGVMGSIPIISTKFQIADAKRQQFEISRRRMVARNHTCGAKRCDVVRFPHRQAVQTVGHQTSSEREDAWSRENRQ